MIYRLALAANARGETAAAINARIGAERAEGADNLAAAQAAATSSC